MEINFPKSGFGHDTTNPLKLALLKKDIDRKTVQMHKCRLTDLSLRRLFWADSAPNATIHTTASAYTLPMTPRKTPTPTPPLRIGILGCANIAKQFTRDVRASKKVRIDAVASRNADTAAAYAAANGIARHHGSYEALLADPAIDAIYIPLPNSLHAEWAIKAAAQGKHILCRNRWRWAWQRRRPCLPLRASTA